MCQREGVVDFAELLLRSYELLTQKDSLREHYRRRFSHVLVDEFQDTNLLQYKWLRALTGPRTAVFAVGDDDQSIYAFRGANVANMQTFERDFATPELPGAADQARAELSLARHDPRCGERTHQAQPVAARQEPVDRRRQGRARAGVLRALRTSTRPAFVVDLVKSLADEGVALSEIALLYRSNAQSRVLEHALFAAGIPYRVYGGMRFFERAEVKHALAYLRLIAEPGDDGALLRVVNFPPRGIGARSIEQLQDHASGSGTTLWQAACSGVVGGKSGAAIAQFVNADRAAAGADAGVAVDRGGRARDRALGLAAHYRNEKDGQDRIENLQELVNAAENFVREAAIATDAPMLSERVAPSAESPADGPQEGATDPLTAFLAHAALEAGDTQAAEGRPALQMMTVHSAKGLEFHTVFVTGLEEGLFPHENSLNEYAGVEEERRLMYVAITRARRRLYLTFAQTRMLHGQTRYHIPSRFLDEVPKDLVQWLSPQRRRAVDLEESEWGSRSVGARADGAACNAARALMAHRAERAPFEVRRGRHHRCRRPRRRRARSGQLPRCRRQVARARVREAGSRLDSLQVPPAGRR